VRNVYAQTLGGFIPDDRILRSQVFQNSRADDIKTTGKIMATSLQLILDKSPLIHIIEALAASADDWYCKSWVRD
jgi:hypothetical protein